MTAEAHRTISRTLEFAAEIDLSASLAPLGRSGDDLIDRWDGRMLVRTVRTAAPLGVLAYAAHYSGSPRLELELPAAAEPVAAEVEGNVRATIALDGSAFQALAADDAAVARLRAVYPGVVPILFPDPFMALLRSISAQQVNLRWAATIRRRLAETYGQIHAAGRWQVWRLEPAPLARAAVAELRALQLTTAKAVAVIGCARAAEEGFLERTTLERMSNEELIAHLTTLRGIGRWSAEWFLARTLGRPQVVAGDLGVRKAIGRLYRTPGLPSEDEVRNLTAHWGAAALHAQALALHDLAQTP